MSFEINWEHLVADGSINQSIREFLDRQFSELSLPSYINDLSVSDFSLGTKPPEITIRHIGDPFEDFYHDDDEGESEGGGAGATAGSGAGASGLQGGFHVQDNSSDDDSSDESSVGGGADESQSLGDDREMHSNTTMGGPGDANAGTLEDHDFVRGVRGSSLSLLNGLHAHNYSMNNVGINNITRSETPTNLFSSQHPYTSVSHMSSNPLLTTGATGAAAAAAAATAAAATGGGAAGAAGAPRAPPAVPKRSETSAPGQRAGAGVRASNAAARNGLAGRDSASPHGGSAGGPSPGIAGLGPAPAQTKSDSDIQFIAEIKYEGDLHLQINVNLLVNYPSPSFITLPIKLHVTDLNIHSVITIAYLKKAVFLSFLCDIDDNYSMDYFSSHHGSGASNTGGNFVEYFAGTRSERIDIIKRVRIESEIGEVEQNVLRNVGKVEKFLVEQLRSILRDEVAWPSWICLDMAGEDEEDEIAGNASGESSHLPQDIEDGVAALAQDLQQTVITPKGS